MSVLLAHEKKGNPTNTNSAIKSLNPQDSSDSSDNDDADMQAVDPG